MIKLFVIGGLLLVSPLLIVVNWPSKGCESSNPSYCSVSPFYRTAVTILPYFMIIGGVIIGYNMKRISDSINSKSQEEEESGEDSGDVSTK
ncbi:MAG: hypothetical protein ACYC7D_09130 [Nitrososphaerales archaeon]